ncbi:DUF4224 domain-containing protein [Halomonas daqingensis]|uniref:DUF4224 domain-containing protein n=1 Tax=Billgrantia desiderata TaxID=52021 RepID=A0AAW4YQJ7_9GAMM|nr:DUF4224 domain-containing protein [Halomonas desiderata]MCE8050261.1 DUF4224 domain-containing protein [Halomonas desiderata]
MIVLSRTELKELTGATRRQKQIDHLIAMGIPYRINADGWPVVLRSAAVSALGGKDTPSKILPREATIDMSFLDL